MIESWFNQDTAQAVKVRYLDGNVFSQDNNGNKVGVNLFTNGADATVSGSISGSIIRSDGVTVSVIGSASANKAWVVLPQDAYIVPGVISIIIKETDGDNITTLCAVVANVYRSTTSTIVDPGTIIPSIEALIATIQEAVDSIPLDYSALNSAVASLQKCAPDELTGVFTAGKTLNSSGSIVTSTSRISTEPFMNVQSASALQVTVVSGYRVNIATYQTESAGTFQRLTGWISSGTRVSLNSTDKFIRWTIAAVGDTSVLTTADADKATLYAECTMIRNVLDLVSFKDTASVEIANIKTRALTASGWTQSTFETGGISESGGNTTNANRIRTAGYINVEGFESLHYDIDTSCRAWIYCYSSASQSSLLMSTRWARKTGILVFPTGTTRIRLCLATLDGTALTTSDYNKVSVSYGYTVRDVFPEIVDTTRWIAIGDSITRGVFSTGDETTPNENATQFGWVDRLAASLGYELTKMASRGIGFEVEGADPEGGADITFSTLLDRVVALPGDYNLITVAIGINDYNNATTLSQIETDVASTITTLATRYPNARIVFITPFNTCNVGSASSQWAYNHTRSGRTLKDIADKIKEVCDSYGIECIYATNGFIFNSVNIQTLELDGVHPSFYGHTLIAKGMAHYLLN